MTDESRLRRSQVQVRIKGDLVRVLNPPLALLYHAVGLPALKPDPEERKVLIRPTAFATQMAQLARRGYRTVTLDEYAASLDSGLFPPRSLLLTFDDAYAHVAEVVTPVLRRHGFTAVMFAPWEPLGDLNHWDRDHPNLARLRIATPELLQAMAAGPWEVASHGMRHLDLTQIEPRDRRVQLTAARERLTDLLGKPVCDLAYPYGTTDQSVCDDARLAGYRMAFIAETAEICDTLQLPRLVIKFDDTPLTFRLKTSSSCGWFYHHAPGRARKLARMTLQATSRA